MRLVMFFLILALLLCACHDERGKAESACRPVIVQPRYCHIFGGMHGLACAYRFDELVTLSRCPHVSPYSAGVEIAGVLKRKGTGYLFYKDQQSAGSDDATAIEVKAIHDTAVDDPRIREKLIGGNVVVVGYYDPMGGNQGSLDLLSVRSYRGTYVIPPPGMQHPIH